LGCLGVLTLAGLGWLLLLLLALAVDFGLSGGQVELLESTLIRSPATFPIGHLLSNPAGLLSVLDRLAMTATPAVARGVDEAGGRTDGIHFRGKIPDAVFVGGINIDGHVPGARHDVRIGPIAGRDLKHLTVPTEVGDEGFGGSLAVGAVYSGDG